MEDSTFFYSVIHPRCSCRQEDGELHDIGRLYRRYTKLLEEGKTSIDALKIIGIKRMCCRSRFLSIPIVPMIDRSKDRVYDNMVRGNVVRKDTEPIQASFRLGLPSNAAKVLPSKKPTEQSIDINDEFGDIPDDI